VTVDHDLPDPPPTQYRSPEEQREHRWKMAWALFTFSLIYSLIHKIFVPLFLSRFPVLVKEYTELDFWFVPALMLWIGVLWHKKLGVWGSFWAGATLAYMGLEAFQILSSNYVGWLLWSRALSSVPVGLMAIYLMTFTEKNRILSWSGLGALLLVPVFLWTHTQKPEFHHEDPQSYAEDRERVWLNAQTSCGLSVYSVAWGNTVPLLVSRFDNQKKQNLLELQECGFAPQVLVLDQEPLELRRDVDLRMNGHLLFFSKDFKKSRNWNQILAQEKQVKIPQSLFQQHEVLALFYSDMRPDLGIVVLLSQRAIEEGFFENVEALHVEEARKLSVTYKDLP
jgi:hypothetical protein